MIDKGARLEANDVAGNNSLHHSTALDANKLTIKIAKVLLKVGGANLDKPTRFGCIPAFEVVMSRRLDCTQLLVRNRAKLDVTNNYEV